MSGDTLRANSLHNKVNHVASRLRHDFHQSKVVSLGDSSSRDWWRHMKYLMGTSSGGVSELQGLENRHTEGNLQSLAESINTFLVSVSEDTPRLTPDHDIFDIDILKINIVLY